MKGKTLSSLTLVALALSWPLAASADDQKKEAPKIKIPDPGVPQVMTIEGRYDRSVIPTRAKKPDGLYLIEGSRPPFEMQWRELEAASAIRRDA